jgi:hypothetical protein
VLSSSSLRSRPVVPRITLQSRFQRRDRLHSARRSGRAKCALAQFHLQLCTLALKRRSQAAEIIYPDFLHSLTRGATPEPAVRGAPLLYCEVEGPGAPPSE